MNPKKDADLFQALVNASHAIEVSPDEANHYWGRGNIYAALRRYDEALSDYGRAIKLNPNVGDFYFSRANSY